jgi:hypothetical protein
MSIYKRDSEEEFQVLSFIASICSGATPLLWRKLRKLLTAGCMLTLPAVAQTASFTGAQRTLGSGFNGPPAWR